MTSTALQIAPLRPRLRLAPAGRARSVAPAYPRRRLLLVLAVATLLAASYVLVGSASTRTAGGAPPITAGAPSASPATVLVGPGDTLWSIAARVAPGVDVRITVDRLITRNGSSPIVVGQELELPA